MKSVAIYTAVLTLIWFPTEVESVSVCLPAVASYRVSFFFFLLPNKDCSYPLANWPLGSASLGLEIWNTGRESSFVEKKLCKYRILFHYITQKTANSQLCLLYVEITTKGESGHVHAVNSIGRKGHDWLKLRVNSGDKYVVFLLLLS